MISVRLRGHTTPFTIYLSKLNQTLAHSFSKLKIHLIETFFEIFLFGFLHSAPRRAHLRFFSMTFSQLIERGLVD